MSTQPKPIILVIDDHRNDLDQASQILNPADYQVVTADSAQSAVSKAAAFEVDLMLCDTSFSSRSHLGLISQIHAIPNRNDIPVIFTSSGQSAGVIRRQHVFGGAYHVKKPFDATVLITLIERTLWMPHLVQTHLNRPHFEIGPHAPVPPSVSIPMVSSSNQTTPL